MSCLGRFCPAFSADLQLKRNVGTGLFGGAALKEDVQGNASRLPLRGHGSIPEADGKGAVAIAE